MSQFQAPTPLNRTHDVSKFDCGEEPLNQFLKQYALTNQASNSARTFVALAETRVVGYYSLAASSLVYDHAPERISKGLAKHPIPILLMARFAVDLEFQGQGLGKGLFVDALKRCISVSQDAAVRAFAVHAKNDSAREFYEKLGMISTPENPYHLYYLLKDIRHMLEQNS